MKKIKDLLEKIKNTSGRHAKMMLILEGAKLKYFKSTLQFAFNPYIVTGIDIKKINKFLSSDLGYTKTAKSPQQVMAYLLDFNTGDDITLKYVSKFIKSQDIDMRDFYINLFTKNIKIGANSKTINAALGENLIPDFNVMLAKSLADHKKYALSKEIIVTPKLDGIRAVYIDGCFFTRGGKQISGLKDIENELIFFRKRFKKYVLDGELIINNRKIGGSFQETIKIVNSDALDKKNISFNIFDMVLMSSFMNQEDDQIAAFRKKNLDLTFDLLKCNNFNHIKMVPILYKGRYDDNYINESLNQAILSGYEGLMINIADAPYEFKRTNNLLKVKNFNSIELEIIGKEMGTGKYHNKLGSLVVNYKNNDLKIGSGFSDDERNFLWDDKDIIGKIVEVSFFEKTENQKGGHSLRFPVFIRIRSDRTLEDIDI